MCDTCKNKTNLCQCSYSKGTKIENDSKDSYILLITKRQVRLSLIELKEKKKPIKMEEEVLSDDPSDFDDYIIFLDSESTKKKA